MLQSLQRVSGKFQPLLRIRSKMPARGQKTSPPVSVPVSVNNMRVALNIFEFTSVIFEMQHGAIWIVRSFFEAPYVTYIRDC
jgi:hypothetical protein